MQTYVQESMMYRDGYRDGCEHHNKSDKELKRIMLRWDESLKALKLSPYAMDYALGVIEAIETLMLIRDDFPMQGYELPV